MAVAIKQESNDLVASELSLDMQSDAYEDGYEHGFVDGHELGSPVLGMVVVSGFCSAFWFSIGVMIGWWL